jgi:O-antigen ligase
MVQSPIVLSIGVALHVAFALILVVAAVWGGGKGISEGIFDGDPILRHVQYLAAFFTVFLLADSAKAQRYLMTGLWTGCVIALGFAISQWIMGADEKVFWKWGPLWSEDYTLENFRIWGSFANPLELVNYLAAFLGMGVVQFCGPLRKHTKLVLGLILFGIVVALTATGSKTVLVVCIVPYLWFLKSTKVVVSALITTGLLGTLSLLGAGRVLLERSQGNIGAMESVVQRIYVFSSSLRMIADHPLLGVGSNNFPDVYAASYRLPLASTHPWTFTPENIFLLAGAELGIPAMLLLVAILARGVSLGTRKWGALPARYREIAIGPEAIMVALICYVLAAQIQAASSAAINLLLFSLLGLQEAMWVQRNWHGIAVSPRHAHTRSQPPARAPTLRPSDCREATPPLGHFQVGCKTPEIDEAVIYLEP